MSIFIGGAWPYANGSLHIGHVASLISGDILARYYRLKGEKVLYVSGSDCHGTPISIKARIEGINAQEITNKYHNEMLDCFSKLGFSYDNFSRTDNDFHKREVQKIFKKIWENGYLYSQKSEQCYCESCKQFLPDRYVEGKCPHCGSVARGDQCDNCTTLLNTVELHDKKCKLCGAQPVVKQTEHLYFKLSSFQQQLNELINTSKGWRENALKYSKRYLAKGLQDRAVTRDIDLGIFTPVPGFENKRIYVWMEAVCGYLTASKEWSLKTGENWHDFWKSDNVIAYYVHGKDNVPFHSLIWPALLLAYGGLHLPDKIISSEYLTLERKKISTSQNWAVWLPDIVDNYNPDAIRYFLIINGPDKRDADFSWREFYNSHNSELLGAFGNFVNRNLVFIKKSFQAKVPNGTMNEALKKQIKELYPKVGTLIEAGEFKIALEKIFNFVRSSNKYFDEQQPWIQVNNDIGSCKNTLYTCVQIIANLANLLEPFIPFAAQKIKSFLHIKQLKWQYSNVKQGIFLGDLQILFERLDKKIIKSELAKLAK